MNLTKNKSKQKALILENARKLREITLNSSALANLVLLIFGACAPFVFYLSNQQNFFDKTLNLSPYKVFYFSSVALLILLSWIISIKTFKLSTKFQYLLLSAIPILTTYTLISSDWSVFLNSQPDRRQTYSSYTTYILMAFLMALVLIKRKRIGVIVNSVAILILTYLSSFLVINEVHPYIANSLNLSIVIHPIIQSVFGIGLQSELRAQYGMYGEFLSPLISFTNLAFGKEVSLIQITSILAVIFFISYFSVYLFLRFHITNQTLLGVSFIGFLYLSLFAVTTWPAELYYQYYPIRLLFPMTSLLVIYAISRYKSDKYLIFVFAYLTLGAFWNLDVGLFTLLAALVYFYVLRYIDPEYKNFELRDVKRTLIPLFTVLVTILLFCLIHFLRFKKNISPELFLASQKLFLSGQIPPLNGVWRFIFLLYASTLVYSIINIHRKHDANFQAQMLFISLLGLGLFLYFINNPHPAVLSNTYWPAFLILIIYTDRLLKSVLSLVTNSKLKLLCAAVLILPLTWVGAVGLINLKNSQILKDQVNMSDLLDPKSESKRALWAQPGAEVTPGEKVSSVSYISVDNANRDSRLQPGWVKKSTSVKNFFENRPIPEKSLAVFSMWDYMIYMDLLTKTPFGAPNFYHTYLDQEWLEIEKNLESPQGVKFVVVDDQFGLWRGDSLAHPRQNINAIKSLLEAKFTLVESDQVGFTWYLDSWKPNILSFYVRK